MGIGVSELLVLFAIVLLIFGTKRLRTIGGDLGGAIREFRSTMNDVDSFDTNRQKNQVTLNEERDG
jgi:sec-independent protein translocase protein TatA